MKYSNDELSLLGNALNEILNGPDAIEDWEFQARIGSTKQEAKNLLKKIRDEIASAE